MKPRIKAYSKDHYFYCFGFGDDVNNIFKYQLWYFDHNYESKVHFPVNTDVMIPYAINPSTGIAKYIKTP